MTRINTSDAYPNLAMDFIIGALQGYGLTQDQVRNLAYDLPNEYAAAQQAVAEAELSYRLEEREEERAARKARRERLGLDPLLE